MLAGGSLREALARPAAARPRRAARARRPAPPGCAGCATRPARRGDLGGTLDQVRAALDQALAARARDARRRRTATTRGWPRWSSRRCPTTRPGAVRALAAYEWHSRGGPRGLRGDPGRCCARGARRAVRRHEAGARGQDPEAMQRVKDMLADLNALLAAHARGEDTTDRFREFMDKHGELFPEQPENVDELIDALARRQAAAERMMASLSPEQREQLGAADERGAVRPRPRLPDGAALRQPAGAAARPGPRRRCRCGRAASRSATATRSRRWPSSPTSRRSSSSSAQASPARTLDDVDVERSSSSSAPSAAADLRALRELERELERQGYLTRGEDGLRLTPRAVRRLGETALRRVFAQIEAAGTGDHEEHRTGRRTSRPGSTRPWVFGDELPIDAVRTVVQRAAARRGRSRPAAAARRGLRGGGDRAAHERPRWRSASTCRSRWCRRAAGGR